jgi:hypothetical protein
LIAVGKPGGPKEALGGLAYRTYLDDSEWQAYVAQKIHDANRIVLLLKDSAGVRWELERVIREGAAAKTLFLVDPRDQGRRDVGRARQYGRAVVARGRAGASRFRPPIATDRILYAGRQTAGDRQRQSHGDIVPDCVLVLPCRAARSG